MPSRRVTTITYCITLVLLALLSLYIRMAFPLVAIGGTRHDEELFLRLAAALGQGQWLGAYDNLTHAKGIGFPVFLMLNRLTGLPLKFTEHVLYLATALLLASTLGRLFRSRWYAVLAFALVAFSPVPWYPDVGGRVVRENFYVGVTLLMFGLAIRCWVLPRQAPSPMAGDLAQPKHLPDNWSLLLWLGLVGGVYWLTREEGVWMAPSMAVLALYGIWVHRKSGGSMLAAAGLVLLPLVGASVVIVSVNTANYVHYGVFRNNDFRSSDFQAGYGALARIRQDKWRNYVVFPRDARERAYAMSPAAAELRPFLEGHDGEIWRAVACGQAPSKDCPEILAGWFVWALRDMVASAGYYKNARAARGYYTRLAGEIDDACRRQPGDCQPARKTLVPPWHDTFLESTQAASLQVFQNLSTLGERAIERGHSIAYADRLLYFADATNSTPAPTVVADVRTPDELSADPADPMTIARWVASLEVNISSAGLPVALGLWVLWLLIALIRRRIDGPLVIATALTAAVVSRVLLLGFLDATSMPSNSMLYLSPVVPLALLLLPTVLWGAFRVFRRGPVGG